MDTSVRIACCQLAPSVERPQDNPALASEAIAAAVEAGAQIVVLPELCNSGYVFESEEEARSAAVPADGDLLRTWAEEAQRGDALVIGGFAELAPDGTLYNSAALVGGEGTLAVYRKLHLWDEEPRWFAHGEDVASVVETRYGRIGLGICYDVEFPELSRGLALAGAELIAMPTNWPREENPPNGRPILHSLVAATAYFNKVFLALCDRSGTERGVEFEGGSLIADPHGAIVAGPIASRGSETICADCDLAAARDKRTSGGDAFADRRPERYVGALADAAEPG
jgi:predicted amidohydrolase